MQNNLVIKETAAINGEIMNTLEPIVVRAQMQIIVNEDLYTLQKSIYEIKEILIKRNFSKEVNITQKYVKTSIAAKYLNVDESFLTKRKHTVFTEGIHFFKPSGESIVRWNIEALEKWLTTTYVNNIDTELDELLQRR